MTHNDLECLSDVAAERAVLAGVFQYSGDAYVDVAELIALPTFTVGSNQTIWACLEHILKESPEAKVDYPTFMSSAKALGYSELFADENEIKHLRAVMNFPVKQENVRKLAGRIRKLEITRLMHRQLGIAQERLLKVTGDEPIDSILGMAEEPVFEMTSLLTTSNGEGPKHMGQGLSEYAEFLANNQRDTVGISSGYGWFDRAIGGGFRPGTVNVVGARPKTGKTLLGMNIGVYVAGVLNCPVLYLDTEMTREDQWVRMLACVSGVTIDEIEKGIYANHPAKKHAIKQAIDKLEKMPYDFLSISGQPFEETMATIRRWVTKRVGLDVNGCAKPCVIVFDYLKLMNSDSMNSDKLAEFQVLGFMMTGLHNLAVRFKLPVLAFIQLNRDGITREDTDVASGSDRIIWLCSNFSIFKAKSDEEMAEQVGQKKTYNRKLIPIVARHGAGLDQGDYIHMQLHGAIAKIVQGPTRNQMSKGESQDGQPKGIVLDDSKQDDLLFSAA